MHEQGTNWFDGLKTFISESRKKRPLFARDSLSAVDEMQCRIIGGSLIAWLQKYGPRFLQERAALSEFEHWEKYPFVVFTSEQPGLVAASQILGDSPQAIAFLYPSEFAAWEKSHPDVEYRWHVHTWSFFTPLDADMLQKAEKYSLSAGESYWLHKEGSMCGPLFGRGGDHLWKWNGQKMELLKECINQWIS